MKSTKFWVILIVVLLAVCLAAAAVLMRGTTDSAVAYIYQNGQLLRTIDLSQVDEPYSFTVEGPAGTNTIQAEPGRICVSHADCPDQVCVNQGWISNSVVPIVCLPNQLVVQIGGAGSPDGIDGVAG